MQNIKREPNGRKQRIAEEQHESAISVAVEARQRIHGLSPTDATDQRAGTVIGRLYMGHMHTRPDGKPWVSQDQYDAAIWYQTKRNDYLCALGSPAAVWDKGASGSGEPDAHETFCKSAVAQWLSIQAAIREIEGESQARKYRAALETFLGFDQFRAVALNNLLIALNSIHKVRINGTKRSRAA